MIENIKRDIMRYVVLNEGKIIWSILRVFLYSPGLWFVCAYRFGKWLEFCNAKLFFTKPLCMLYGYAYFLFGVFAGIDIPLDTEIGPGLYIGHYGGIVLHPKSVLGENCNLSQGVTIGEGGRNRERGVPVIGDRVYIGPRAKIFGQIVIGNDVAIGANAVVTKSAPNSAVLGGVPAAILSFKGSSDFVKF